jgi:5-methylcytosine-specific restriction protein A
MSNSQQKLINEFHKDMLKIYENAKKECGYNASRFIQMVANEGGYNVAKKFIHSNAPSDGFIKLWELNRLDLTVEALILKEKYQPLFSNEEREIVKNRLKEYGYDVEQSDRQEISVPKLEPVSRSREYSSYDDEIRDKVVYEYLFHSRSHRWLDENIIGIDPEYSRGYQSMGILHYIGLKNQHKGIFENLTIDDALEILQKQNSDFSLVIEVLERLRGKKVNISEQVVREDIEAELFEEQVTYKEGAVQEYYGKRYERNPESRKKAIEIHGLNCVVCGFNFEEVYGERGKDFIEVHHVKPLSTIKEEVEINPETDLVPVCANCHRMIHRRKDDVLTIEELKSIVEQRKIEKE